jgi:hypothetical protein
MNENWKYFSEETKQLIYQELKSIAIKPGQCIVCNNSLVSDKTTENISLILKENKINDRIVKEYEKFFVGK